MISRAYKTRMYPSPEQERVLFRWGNALRGIWNTIIREGRREWAEANFDFDEQARWEDDGGPVGPPILRETPLQRKHKSGYARTTEGPEWMREVPGTFRSQKVRHLEVAWKNFQRTGRPPTFHKKNGHLSMSGQGIRFTSPDHILVPASLSLSKEEKSAMRMPIRLAEPLRDRIAAGRPGRGPLGKSPARAPGWKGSNSGDVATITFEAGAWFISFPTVDHHPPAPRDEQLASRGVPKAAVIGVDANCGAFVCSDGTVYSIPEALRRLDSMIEETHRALARSEKGSKRRNRTKELLQKRYARQARIREDWLNKITYDLVTRSSVVVIEDLNTKAMTRSAKGTQNSPGKNVASKAGLNRSILRASFGKFREKLMYKGAWYGTEIIAVPPAFTSQDCSRCGARKRIPLNVRTYKCDKCQLVADRDLNAAINIRDRFLRSQAQEVPGASGFKDGTGVPELRQFTRSGQLRNRDRASIKGGDTNACILQGSPFGAQLPPPHTCTDRG